MSVERKNFCFKCKKVQIGKFFNELLKNDEYELKSDEVKTLLTCGSCKIGKYCSKSCQQEDWNPNCHKKYCKQIASLSKDVKNMEKGGIKRIIAAMNENDKFHLRMPLWCVIGCEERTKTKSPKTVYIFKKMSLACAIWNMAEQTESYAAYEAFLQQVTEIMPHFDDPKGTIHTLRRIRESL